METMCWKAIEEYSVSFHVQGECTESSSIAQLFVFGEGAWTVYYLTKVDIHLGEMTDFSDEEIVSRVNEQLLKEDMDDV